MASDGNSSNQSNNKSDNTGFQVSKAGRKALAAAKAGIKAASGDYVGAAKEAVVGFGEEISKILLGVFIIILIPIVMFTSAFASLPGLLIHNFETTIGNVRIVTEDKIGEWSVKQANKYIINAFDEIQKEVSDEILKEIKDAYIPNWTNNCKNYWSGKSYSYNDTESFGIFREKNTANLLGVQHYNNNNHGEMYTMLRMNNVTAKETNLDSIRFMCAYSVWHQKETNNVGSDEHYLESSDMDERWSSFDVNGLKKFIKNNKETLLSVDIEYSDEHLAQKYINEDGTAEYIDVPVKVVNATLNIADENDIYALFNLSELDKKMVDTYYQLAKALFEAAYEGSTDDLYYNFEPMSAVVKNVFFFPDETKTKVYQSINALPKFGYDLFIDEIPAERFDGDYQSILKQMTEDWERTHPPKDPKFGYPVYNHKVLNDYPVYSSGNVHYGVDFSVPIGTEVHASAGGRVYAAGWDSSLLWFFGVTGSSEASDHYRFGKVVVIQHEVNGSAMYTIYANNSELMVEKGDYVKKGDVIALSGDTGEEKSAVCHFQMCTSLMFMNLNTVDPKDYLTDEEPIVYKEK